jgi:hypothetical protein
VHPPWLHRFTFAPWMIQAPPLTAPLVASSLHFCIMAHTNSSFFGVIGAPNVAASLHLCTMADINPSHLGVVGASIEGADMSVFFRCPGAIIFFTLIFHDCLGFFHPDVDPSEFFLARRLEACWCRLRQWQRRCWPLRNHDISCLGRATLLVTVSWRIRKIETL